MATLARSDGDPPAGATAVRCDLSRPAETVKAVREAGRQLGGIDILVNCAGAYPLARIEEVDEEIQSQVFGVNLIGPVNCIRAAVPFLREAGGGDIINISSESVANPFPYLSLYAAAKAGLETLTTALQMELRADAIRVSAVRVGAMGGSGAPREDGELARAFGDEAVRGGQFHWMGALMDRTTVADAVIRVLETPRDARIDLMVIRAARPHPSAS